MKKIQALEGNSMEPGKVYNVSDESAEALLALERAIEAKKDMEVGKVYPLPEDPNKDLLGDNSKGDKPKNKKKTNKLFF